MATSLTSKPRVKAVILAEASGQRSRENIVVKQTGTALESGTLLTKVDTGADSGKYIAYTASGAAGPADAVLYNWLPAKTGDSDAVGFVRDAELNRFELVGLDEPAVADLATKGLIVRGTPNLPHVSTPAL